MNGENENGLISQVKPIQPEEKLNQGSQAQPIGIGQSAYNQQQQSQQQVQPLQQSYPPQQQGYPMQQQGNPMQQGYPPQQQIMYQQQSYPPQQFQQQQSMQMQPTMQFQPAQNIIVTPEQLSQGPCTISCHNCKRQGITRVEESTCNINCCCWFLFFGILGACGYAFCCKSAHGFKHYCSSCGTLNYTKKSKCCP